MWFPLFINLENKKVLVIGGGKVAAKKIEKILEYGADITVVTENVVEEKLLKLENVKIENNQKIENDKAKIEKLVKGYFLVIAATDNEELNENIANVCDSNGMLINNVSSKVKMNAMFGGIVKNSEFQIAISTSGKNCKRSRAMKSEIQKVLDKIAIFDPNLTCSFKITSDGSSPSPILAIPPIPNSIPFLAILFTTCSIKSPARHSNIKSKPRLRCKSFRPI